MNLRKFSLVFFHFLFLLFSLAKWNTKIWYMPMCGGGSKKSAHKTAKPQKNINYALHFCCNKRHEMFSFLLVDSRSHGLVWCPGYWSRFYFNLICVVNSFQAWCTIMILLMMIWNILIKLLQLFYVPSIYYNMRNERTSWRRKKFFNYVTFCQRWRCRRENVTQLCGNTGEWSLIEKIEPFVSFLEQVKRMKRQA